MSFYRVSSLAVIAAVLASSAVARADTPLRTLVYNFTYSSSQSITARDSATSVENPDQSGNLTGGSNGMSHYGGALDDKGTMTVAVLRKQADGGLVVTIAEAGQSTRRAPATMCVIYGNTNVICDPNKTVYTEEYTLLRFLGVNFVDPTQLDANRHWSFSQNRPDETIKADYTINTNSSGSMQIGEVRTIKEAGAGHLETDVQTKIGYDFNRAVPTMVDEYATQYTDGGPSGTSRNIFQTTLQLVTDTMAKI